MTDRELLRQAMVVLENVSDHFMNLPPPDSSSEDEVEATFEWGEIKKLRITLDAIAEALKEETRHE